MQHLQKAGGIAALIQAATFVVGFGLLFTLLAPSATGELSPGETVTFVTEHQTLMQLWNFIIYVVFGIALVVLVLALHARLREEAPALMPIATAFGLIWAGLVIASGMVANISISTVVDLSAADPNQAATVWLSLESVRDGIGGGNEIVGGLWVMLVGFASIRAEGLPQPLAVLGVVIGAAGVLTSAPALDFLAVVFGLGLVVWFVWLGIALLRAKPVCSTQSSTPFVEHPGTAD